MVFMARLSDVSVFVMKPYTKYQGSRQFYKGVFTDRIVFVQGCIVNRSKTIASSLKNVCIDYCKFMV